jgi:hypothetical protein
VDTSILKILKAQQLEAEEQSDKTTPLSSSSSKSLYDGLIADSDNANDVTIEEARRASLAAAGVNVDIQLIRPVIPKDMQGRSYDWTQDDADPVVAIGLNLSIVIGVVVAALLVIQTITSEKKDKLLGRMRIMGMTESAYWVTWFFTYCIFAIFASLLFRKYNCSSADATKLMI